MKPAWEDEIEEDVRLNDGDNEKVILKRDPSKDGNIFGQGSNVDFTYSGRSGTAKLALQKDPSTFSSSQGSDMSYYIEGTIKAEVMGNLIMNLNSTGGKGLLKLYGGYIQINQRTTAEINNINKIVIDATSKGGIEVLDGSTLNINNVDSLINVSSTSASASIYNNNSTLYIDADVYNYDKDTSTGGGYFRQTGENAKTTIEGSFYNAGFKSGSGGRQDALVHINGGTFTVNGNFENGKNDTYASSDYYGIGNVKADNGALITVNGNFISDAQRDSSNGLVRYSSTVDLNNANLAVKGKFDVSRTDIYLKNTAKIYTTDFTLNDSATMNFVGVDTGFGYINASSSANFNGIVDFVLEGLLLRNPNNSYLFLESKNVSGNIKEGSVIVVDSSTGRPLSESGYTTNIVKVGDKYFLVFGEANNEGNENYPNANAQPPGGHLDGYKNGVPLPDEGGDTGDGEQGGSGNEGSGGDNQGGNSGSDDKPTPPSPNTPPSSDPIYNAIYEALDGSIINNNNLIRTAASTVEKQIETMQDERKTYQGSLIYHNMLGRIAHLSSRNNNIAFNKHTPNTKDTLAFNTKATKTNFSFNTKDSFASLVSDYTPYYLNYNQDESNNVYISALAGYSNYKNSSGSEFGASFGYDKEIVDEFFAGFYASISNSRIETEGMYLDGFNYSLGLYSRAYLPYSLELDVLGYYANNHNKYDRIFAGLSSIHKGDYKRHNIGAQARLGYRFEFVNENSIKPYLGILSSSYYMPEYKESGILPISRSTNTFTSLL